ncbi:MAG: hypothetical protein AMS26_18430 [Bacteroides sp. SM23_62]|nr:MAG: hypothetical protein AMS26_18430 [Bacteroides sp. SM23_62]
MKTAGRFGMIIFTVLVLSGGLIQAQWEEKPPLRDRIFFGGNFGLQFGTVTNIEISPLAGIYLTPRLAMGPGIRYEYYKSNYPGFVPYETHIYGGTVFARYMVIKNMGEAVGLGLNFGLFGHSEYEILSLESRYFEIGAPPDAEGRFNLHSVLLGGGIYQPIGRRAGFLIMILWNLNETASSPYSNPIFRIGFNF